MNPEEIKDINESIGKLLADKGIEIAVIAYVNPQENGPRSNTIIFYRGHEYDVAKLISFTAGEFRTKVMNDLRNLFPN